MVGRPPLAIVLTAAFSIAACSSENHPPKAVAEPADLVLLGGAVYTVDAARSWARIVAVREGLIIYVGIEPVPPELIGPGTEVVDLAGKMVLPGFQDAHVHPASSGADLAEIQLDDVTTAEAAVDAIRAYAQAHPESKWIRGAGWQLPLFPRASPSKALLDRAVPDRPALLWAADGHSAWVNSKALAIAGITRDTPDPPNGRIERDRPIAVKLFADGVIESRTAAMLEPYLDRRGDAGTPNYTQPTLDRLVADLDRDGFQVHVHANGDRAIRMTLDAFERARARNGVRDSRHSIAHLELIDPADIPRFRSLGVIANFEALWANGDDYLTRLTEPALGPVRSRWLYPIASVARTGAVVTGGSDWSVSSLNPLDAIEMGITHRDPARPAMAAWHPMERVDLPTMIALYTINAAYAHRQERETGSIEVGKLADLQILDRDLFEVPVDSIHRVHVLRTLLGGVTVYERTK